jgi:hypothetical protein
MSKVIPEALQERILALIDNHVQELEKKSMGGTFAPTLSFDLTRYLKGITDFADHEKEKRKDYQKTLSKMTDEEIKQQLAIAMQELEENEKK